MRSEQTFFSLNTVLLCALLLLVHRTVSLGGRQAALPSGIALFMFVTLNTLKPGQVSIFLLVLVTPWREYVQASLGSTTATRPRGLFTCVCLRLILTHF